MTLAETLYRAGCIGGVPWDELGPQARAYWHKLAAVADSHYRVEAQHAYARMARLAESGEVSPSQLWGKR